MSDSVTEAEARAAARRARRDAARHAAQSTQVKTPKPAPEGRDGVTRTKPSDESRQAPPQRKPKEPQAPKPKPKPAPKPKEAAAETGKTEDKSATKAKHALEKPAKATGLKWLIGFGFRIGVLVGGIVLVLIGIDFGAAAVAEHRMSQQAAKQLELDNDPAVMVRGAPFDIYGFPFSNQALAGEYEHITVEATNVPVSKQLRDVTLRTDFYGMQADLSDVLDGNTNVFKIPRTVSSVDLRQTDLGRALGVPNLTVQPASVKYVTSADPKDDVSVPKLEERREADMERGKAGTEAGVRLRGRISDTDVAVYALVTLNGSKVTIDPKRVETADGKPLPYSATQPLLEQAGGSVKVPQLPFEVKARGVSVKPGAVIVQGTAKNLDFAG